MNSIKADSIENITIDPEAVVKRVYMTLQYLPSKYSSTTLSSLLSIYMMSKDLIEIPEKTSFQVSPNDYVYTYMIPSIDYVFKEMSNVSCLTIGKLAFVVQHIVQNISREGYRFFF